MLDPGGRSSVRPWAWLAGFTLATALLVLIGRTVLPVGKLCPDFICFWTAGKLLTSGHSPYDIALQRRIQEEHGWNKATNGLGIYDFLPYYYPPWFGLVCGALVPLGYPTAKLAWLVINVELLLLTGYLLRHAVAGVPRAIPMVVVPIFAFSVVSVLVGQTSVLIFFLLAGAWRLLEHARDRSAGAALAWLTIKPQLTAVLLLGIMLWAVRRGRWGVVQGFLVVGVLLGLASSMVVPSWPIQMIHATQQTPPPTEYFPWIGTTWFLVLKTIGLRGGSLWVLYLAVALPLLGVVVRSALDRTCPLPDVLALGCLAAFFIAPYDRHYDFPVLLIPALVLLGGRLTEKLGSALVIVLVVVPYVHFALLSYWKSTQRSPLTIAFESTFFWIPVLLAVLWLTSRPAVHPPPPYPVERL